MRFYRNDGETSVGVLLVRAELKSTSFKTLSWPKLAFSGQRILLHVRLLLKTVQVNDVLIKGVILYSYWVGPLLTLDCLSLFSACLLPGGVAVYKAVRR